MKTASSWKKNQNQNRMEGGANVEDKRRFSFSRSISRINPQSLLKPYYRFSLIVGAPDSFLIFMRGINGPMSVVIFLLLLPLAQGQWAPPRSLGDPDVQRQLAGFVSTFNRRAFGAANYDGGSRPPFAAPLPNSYFEKTTPNPYKPPDPQPRPEFKSQQTNFYPTQVSNESRFLEIQLFRNFPVLQLPSSSSSPTLQLQPQQFLRRS